MFWNKYDFWRKCKEMKIGIVSGKGGAGKTLVSVNLTYVASQNNSVTLYDLDVEEPNSFLFFNENDFSEESVKMMIPKVDEVNCNHCGVCSKVCEFNAIISIGDQTLVFPELCHSCYACLELCPSKAITEEYKEIGKVRTIVDNDITLIEGRLNISETSAPALIREVKKKKSNDTDVEIYDSPPGTSCSVVEALKDIDYAVIVAEPTLFGFHDFKLMVETIKSLNKNFGVIINKYTPNNKLVEDFCLENNFEILGRIPFSYEIASTYAHGKIICEEDSELNSVFKTILDSILRKANGILI